MLKLYEFRYRREGHSRYYPCVLLLDEDEKYSVSSIMANGLDKATGESITRAANVCKDFNCNSPDCGPSCVLLEIEDEE